VTAARIDLSGKVGLAVDDLNDVLDITIGFDVHSEWPKELRLTVEEWHTLFDRFGLDEDKIPPAIKPDMAWKSALKGAKAVIDARCAITLTEKDQAGENIVVEDDVTYTIYFEDPVKREDGALFARLVRKRPFRAKERRARRQDYDLTTVTSVVWSPSASAEWLPDPVGIDPEEFPEFDYASLLAAAEQDWILRRSFFDGNRIGKAVTEMLNDAGGYITKPSGGTWLIEANNSNLAMLDAIEAFKDTLVGNHHWESASDAPPNPEFAYIPIAGIKVGVRRVRKWVEDQVVKDLRSITAEANDLAMGMDAPSVTALAHLDEERDQALARLERYGEEIAATPSDAVEAAKADLAAARKRAAARRRSAIRPGS
jgi:hypothetical protein